MGKILSICSDDKKTGKSVVTYLLANNIRKISQGELKILVCCLNSNYSALYKLFGIDLSAVGLEDLVNYKVSEENKSDVLLSIIPKNNDIYFLGSYRTTNSFVQKSIGEYCKLFERLQHSFDLIIFDTVSENGNALSQYMIKKADIIVRLFVQDNESMKRLYYKEGQLPFDRKTLYIVSKYRDIYPRVSDIKRRYSLKELFKLDYCEKLQEMKNRDSLHLYLQHETSCNDSMNSISKYILETMGLIVQKKHQLLSIRQIWKLKLLRFGGKESEHNKDYEEFVPKGANGLS